MLFGHAQEMRSRWQITVSGVRARDLDTWLDRARDAVGAKKAKLALERGRRMTLDEALALAASIAKGGDEATPGSALPP